MTVTDVCCLLVAYEFITDGEADREKAKAIIDKVLEPYVEKIGVDKIEKAMKQAFITAAVIAENMQK